MQTALEPVRMARPKGSKKRSERDDVAVKIDRGIVAKAKLVAAEQKVPLAEYLSEALREPVARAYLALFRKLEGKADKP